MALSRIAAGTPLADSPESLSLVVCCAFGRNVRSPLSSKYRTQLLTNQREGKTLTEMLVKKAARREVT